MFNTVDHSSAERYYNYAGIHGKEFHVGTLDMGVTIPAKLDQKYRHRANNDEQFLRLALEYGTTTRRQREGGLGLNSALESIRSESGTLIVISRNAQIRKYLKNRITHTRALKKRLSGTWCCVRFKLGKP